MIYKKLNTGVLTRFNDNGGRVKVTYPEDKFLRYLNCFIEKEKVWMN